MKILGSTWFLLIYLWLVSTNALATVITASLMNIEWHDLSGTKKFVLIWVIVQNWTGLLTVFFSKIVSRSERGLPPVPTGDTEVLTKEKTT
jgi:hypothetical protein